MSENKPVLKAEAPVFVPRVAAAAFVPTGTTPAKPALKATAKEFTPLKATAPAFTPVKAKVSSTRRVRAASRSGGVCPASFGPLMVSPCSRHPLWDK